MSKDTRFSIHDWQAKQRLAESNPLDKMFGGNPLDKFPSTESMSNADIELLDSLVKKYSDLKLKNTIDILRDRPLEEKDLDEMNTTGAGTSISTGNSGAYATPKAFKKKRKDD